MGTAIRAIQLFHRMRLWYETPAERLVFLFTRQPGLEMRKPIHMCRSEPLYGRLERWLAALEDGAYT